MCMCVCVYVPVRACLSVCLCVLLFFRVFVLLFFDKGIKTCRNLPVELLSLYLVSIYSFCLLPSGADLVAYVRAAISLCICGKHEEAMVPLFKGTGLLKVWFV